MTNPAPTPTPTALTRGPASNKQVGGERHKLLLAAILTPRRRVRVVWMLRCVFKSTELVHSQRGAKKKKKKKNTPLHSTPLHTPRLRWGSSIPATVQIVNMLSVKVSLSRITVRNQIGPVHINTELMIRLIDLWQLHPEAPERVFFPRLTNQACCVSFETATTLQKKPNKKQHFCLFRKQEQEEMSCGRLSNMRKKKEAPTTIQYAAFCHCVRSNW